jgi:hypothetical protein
MVHGCKFMATDYSDRCRSLCTAKAPAPAVALSSLCAVTEGYRHINKLLAIEMLFTLLIEQTKQRASVIKHSD